MTPAIHTAQDDLSNALSFVADPDQRRLVRHAISRLEQAYRNEVRRLQELSVRSIEDQRDTLPAPAPRGPDLAPGLQASLDRLNGRTGT